MTMREDRLQCRRDAFDAADGTRYRELRARIKASSGEVRERDDGYAIRLSADPAVFRDAAEWIGLERQCCPFLSLGVSWRSDDGVWLELTGAPEVKRFLAQVLPTVRGDEDSR